MLSKVLTLSVASMALMAAVPTASAQSGYYSFDGRSAYGSYEACEQARRTGSLGGAAVGGALGAGLGALAGGNDTRNSIVGGVVGAIAGSSVGRNRVSCQPMQTSSSGYSSGYSGGSYSQPTYTSGYGSNGYSSGYGSTGYSGSGYTTTTTTPYYSGSSYPSQTYGSYGQSGYSQPSYGHSGTTYSSGSYGYSQPTTTYRQPTSEAMANRAMASRHSELWSVRVRLSDDDHVQRPSDSYGSPSYGSTAAVYGQPYSGYTDRIWQLPVMAIASRQQDIRPTDRADTSRRICPRGPMTGVRSTARCRNVRTHVAAAPSRGGGFGALAGAGLGTLWRVAATRAMRRSVLSLAALRVRMRVTALSSATRWPVRRAISVAQRELF